MITIAISSLFSISLSLFIVYACWRFAVDRSEKTHAAAAEVVSELETRLQVSMGEQQRAAEQSRSAMAAVPELTEEEAADGWEVVTKKSSRR